MNRWLFKIDDLLSTVLYGGFIALVTYITAEDAPAYYTFGFKAAFFLSIVVLASNVLRVFVEPLEENSNGQRGMGVSSQQLEDTLNSLQEVISELSRKIEHYHSRELQKAIDELRALEKEVKGPIYQDLANIEKSIKSILQHLGNG